MGKINSQCNSGGRTYWQEGIGGEPSVLLQNRCKAFFSKDQPWNFQAGFEVCWSGKFRTPAFISPHLMHTLLGSKYTLFSQTCSTLPAVFQNQAMYWLFL